MVNKTAMYVLLNKKNTSTTRHSNATHAFIII